MLFTKLTEINLFLSRKKEINLLLLSLQMQPVKYAMDAGRKYISHCTYENNPAEQSIQRGKYLTSTCEAGSDDRPHSTQYHGCVMERVKPPGKRFCGIMIPDSADEQYNGQQA